MHTVLINTVAHAAIVNSASFTQHNEGTHAMKAVAVLALTLCVCTAQADWVNELRLTLSNYALAPVKQTKTNPNNA